MIIYKNDSINYADGTTPYVTAANTKNAISDLKVAAQKWLSLFSETQIKSICSK